MVNLDQYYCLGHDPVRYPPIHLVRVNIITPQPAHQFESPSQFHFLKQSFRCVVAQPVFAVLIPPSFPGLQPQLYLRGVEQLLIQERHSAKDSLHSLALLRHLDCQMALDCLFVNLILVSTSPSSLREVLLRSFFFEAQFAPQTATNETAKAQLECPLTKPRACELLSPFAYATASDVSSRVYDDVFCQPRCHRLPRHHHLRHFYRCQTIHHHSQPEDQH